MIRLEPPTKKFTCSFQTIQTERGRVYNGGGIRDIRISVIFSTTEQVAWIIVLTGDTGSFQIFCRSLTLDQWFPKTSHISVQSKGMNIYPFSGDRSQEF